MAVTAERSTSRLMKLRRICGYGAAVTVMPYLLIVPAGTGADHGGRHRPGRDNGDDHSAGAA